TDLPTKGAAAGTGVTKAQLCREVIACIRATKCDFLGSDIECYCGKAKDEDDHAANSQRCAVPGMAHGPCKDVFEAAAEAEAPSDVIFHSLDLPQIGSNGNALGAALNFLWMCETPPP